jgi:hypothetical protein
MIDVQDLASSCNLEPRGQDYNRDTGRWDEDTDLHIPIQDGVSLPFLRDFAEKVLEAATEELEAMGNGSEVGSYIEAIRALKPVRQEFIAFVDELRALCRLHGVRLESTDGKLHVAPLRRGRGLDPIQSVVQDDTNQKGTSK